MIEYNYNKIRNIGLFGHGGCGKTTIGEAILFLLKQNTRLGRVDDGTSLLDYDDDEIARKNSINLALGYGQYKDYYINLIDTPGYLDFFGDVLSGLKATDNAIVVIDAGSGIGVGTELVWKELKKSQQPKLVFINKLKKEHADFYKTVEEVLKDLGSNGSPVFLPLGKESNFNGLIDLLQNKSFSYEDGTPKEIPIPEPEKPKVQEYREKLIEVIAEASELIMNKYLEGKEITQQELTQGLKEGIKNGAIYPILLGDGYHNIGIDRLLDFVCDYFEPVENFLGIDPKTKEKTLYPRNSDGTPVAFVFKTVSEPHIGDLNYVKIFSGSIATGMTLLNTREDREEKINQIYYVKGKERSETNKLRTGEIGALVKLKFTKTSDTISSSQNPISIPPIEFPEPSISIAIVPKSKGDEEKVSNGLARLAIEDPTFNYKYEHELKQQLISGLGELHLDVIIGRLKRKFEVAVDVEKPKVPYRETITKKSEAQGKYKRQTGGRGQYGDVWLRLEPKERGFGYEFVDEIYAGAVPAKYIPSVEKGVVEAMSQGIIAGYPVIDFQATIYDGSYHVVDSSDIAFKIAGSMAFKNACEKAGMILLEPIMQVSVTIPEKFMGDIIGDLNARRGRILGIETEGSLQKVNVLVPQAEMYKYSTTLRSITQGRGYFTMKFSHYEEVPKEIAQKIIDESRRVKEE